MEIRELLRRDINRRIANEGVAKVWDNDVLLDEIRDYVVTDEIAGHLQSLTSAFLESMDVRGSASARESMGIWVSGFFGSGKSHFAKIVGHLFANDVVDPASEQRALDAFTLHIEDTPQASGIKADFHRLRTRVSVLTVMFEIKAKEDLTNPNSVAEICLASFYEGLGYSRTIHIARIEQLLVQHNAYVEFKSFYENEFGEAWATGRSKHAFSRPRIAKALAHCLPQEYPDEATAERSIDDAKRYETITAETFAKELLSYLDGTKRQDPHREPHILFVIDEMQQFVGDSGDRIEELRAIIENLGARGKGRIWMLCTGQEALDRVVDRAGLNLAALGKVGARFGARVDLRSEDVSKVTCEVLLKKKEPARPTLAEFYRAHDGFYADCSRLNTERQLLGLSEEAFVQSYPFLPYQMPLAQEIFDTMRGTRLSGNERSMLAVVQPIVKRLAHQRLGALVPLDWFFDEIEGELCSDDHLGGHGVRAIREADQKVEDWDVSPTRCLKALWLVQRLNWLPRTADTLARLMATETAQDLVELSNQVDRTLELLRAAGYIALDESSDQYKFLSAEEGQIEKALIDKQAGYGLGPAVRRAKELTKERVMTRQRMTEFRVLYGKSNAPIDYSLTIDGEVVQTGGQITLEAYGPLSTVKIKELERANLAAGEKGTTIYWLAQGDSDLETRLKRLEALQWLISDPKQTTGRSARYIQAIEEKRREAQELEQSLVEDLVECFRRGRILYSGDSMELDGKADLRMIANKVMGEIIPNLYTRLGAADVAYDADDVNRFMDPKAKKLDEAASNLGLFDSSGQLLGGGPLVEPIMYELKRREDEAGALDGDSLLEHFAAIPFGWPNDLVRLVLAAAFRGGAIAVMTGGKRRYDFTDPATAKCFTGIREFKKAHFVPIVEGLTPAQIAAARQVLIALGVEGVQESANEQARAVRSLSVKFIAAAQRAASTASYDIPLPETHKKVATVCEPIRDEEDPTKVVNALLKDRDEWEELQTFFEALDEFIDEQRDRAYRQYQRLAAACRDNPPLARSDQAGAVQAALAELDAIVAAREVMSKWGTYRENAEELAAVYRTAYRAVYDKILEGTTNVRAELEEAPEWSQLGPEKQQTIADQYFGPSGPLGLTPSPVLASVGDLIAATAKHSLTALEAIETALPQYEAEIMERVQEALAQQQREEGKHPPKICRYRIGEKLGKRQVNDRDELRAALTEVEADVGELLDDGNTVILE